MATKKAEIKLKIKKIQHKADKEIDKLWKEYKDLDSGKVTASQRRLNKMFGKR
jgi:hypothetical protein